MDKSERLPPAEPQEADEKIGFSSGDPFVEITEGILHLYKEDALRDRQGALCLCLLGVPATMSCHDLLAFTALCHADIAHIRVLRDTAPNQYMALLVFRTHAAAAEFYATHNGAPYSGLEPKRVCRAVWVSRVEWTEGHTELPRCPVCLKLMDESVDAVLTILCKHSFHAGCLVKWGDSTCPVCRCVQSPELSGKGNKCSRCHPYTRPVAANSLWICLFCDNIGCGRYQGGHAADHYRHTGHLYALQLGSRRVWDYKGDNFVHRLLQNKADGKLVPSDGGSDDEDAGTVYSVLQEKVDSQRRYFEDIIERKESASTAEILALHAKKKELQTATSVLEKNLIDLLKEKMAVECKVKELEHKLFLAETELDIERHHGNEIFQEQWKSKCFQSEANDAIAKSDNRDEIASGTVTVGPPADDKPPKNKNRKMY